MDREKIEAFRSEAHKTLAAAIRPPKVTIYFKGAMGFGRVEGRLLGITKASSGSFAGVEYLSKGGTRPKTMMNYYYPFWIVIEGWGYTDPSEIGYEKPVDKGGIVTRRSKYKSTDPRWVEDFMREIGSKLKSKTIAVQKSGQTKILKPNLVPETR